MLRSWMFEEKEGVHLHVIGWREKRATRRGATTDFELCINITTNITTTFRRLLLLASDIEMTWNSCYPP
jgi:hypothetical protein